MVECPDSDHSDGSSAILDDSLDNVPRGLDPLGGFASLSRALIRIADGSCTLSDVRREAATALQGMALETAANGVEEQGCVVVSTAHITQADSAILGEVGTIQGLVDVCATRYGYLVHLGPALDDSSIDAIDGAMDALGLSTAFRALWLGMRARGYAWLQVDRDADTVDGFEVFSW